MINQSQDIDLKNVTCGLVPAILAELSRHDEDEVHVLVRQGIQDELWNSFGSGGEWEIEIQEDLFHDRIIFRRIRKQSLDPLNLMDF
ncbi:hypothetical protein [Salidesulfovibrio onnuriiensis]|uniref:hypothetical protein n=1 Tax=Salidesulfovibrio onnuriiensis TaxID=2583823 RepID=UPI00202B4EC0|nr:hypothetical protein [Salidesulfovibrio onnuriiensis]